VVYLVTYEAKIVSTGGGQVWATDGALLLLMHGTIFVLQHCGWVAQSCHRRGDVGLAARRAAKPAGANVSRTMRPPASAATICLSLFVWHPDGDESRRRRPVAARP
jgi:hypothetical protein